MYIQCVYEPFWVNPNGDGQVTSRLRKWGNSLALRIPRSVAIDAQLGEGDCVDVSANKGVIVIRPSRRTYSLQELVDAITPRNRHDETDWGRPVGHEAW
jgi:antitoxin MazE